MSNINSGTQQLIVNQLAIGGHSLGDLSRSLPGTPVNTIRGSLTKLAKRGEVVRQGRTWYRATPSAV
jgi:DNA-binding HxlR family transcriptional regulator